MRTPSSFILVVTLVFAVAAGARPPGPREICDRYDEAPACAGRIPACAFCHTSPPILNPFGEDVASALYANAEYLYDDASFASHVGGALASIEGDDSDGDAMSNLEEISLGARPGDAKSFVTIVPTPVGPRNPTYDVGSYDPRFAYRRVVTLYCGRPPTYAEVKDVAASDDPMALVDEKLAECLGSDYWRHEGLHRLADKRVRPLEAVGFDGIIPLADYAWDYRLFAHVLTDDRDARDLLLATYHVDEGGSVVTGVVPAPAFSLLGTGGQPLEPARRAGMITTQWFLMIHTMFSALPRTTAAQAYRAYLGVDIAQQEGLLPVEGEPRDVDQKGVTEPTCAQCHSTLDALSYAFSPYNGIGNLGDVGDFGETGRYNADRVPWSDDGILLGRSVSDLVEWSEEAAESDLFQQSLARMFYEHAIGRAPLPGDETVEFDALWRTLDEDAFSANKLIARIVRSNAFGVP